MSRLKGATFKWLRPPPQLTMSCSSFKTSTSQLFALSTKAWLKSLKRTRQDSFGVVPFSLFSSRDAAFSSRSQITTEISAKKAPSTHLHRKFVKKCSHQSVKSVGFFHSALLPVSKGLLNTVSLWTNEARMIAFFTFKYFSCQNKSNLFELARIYCCSGTAKTEQAGLLLLQVIRCSLALFNLYTHSATL